MEPIHFHSIIETSDNKLWGNHFVVPAAIAALFLNKGSQRVICTINHIHSWQCALLPFGDNKRVISINKTLLKKMGLQTGMQLEVELVQDNSEYGLPVPEEFSELLNMDGEGKQLFENLTDGKKRTLLYIAAQPKKSEGRVIRAIAIVEHLKKMNGKIDFKVLSQDLKNQV
ncbi:MAG: YdeI/OmpD-associated family protein [Saprospiraceae bacterium]